MAIYECRKCEKEQYAPRRFRYHLGPSCRCPICGTYRVVRLKAPDKIDRKHGGFLNLVERLLPARAGCFTAVGAGCNSSTGDRWRPTSTRVQTVQPAAALVPEVEKTAGPAQ